MVKEILKWTWCTLGKTLVFSPEPVVKLYPGASFGFLLGPTRTDLTRCHQVAAPSQEAELLYLTGRGQRTGASSCFCS